MPHVAQSGNIYAPANSLSSLVGADAVDGAKLTDLIASSGYIQDCNTQLLWGELGWQIGSIATDKYTTKFLAIADKVLDGDYDRQGIVSLLQEIESDGYKVDWDSCVEIDSEPQSRWLCFKITVLKWFRRLLGE